MTAARVYLSPGAFGERERPLLEHGTLRASTFRFGSGVCGLRLQNARGELVLLPFQGQQLWSARFLDRELAMRSMFDEPKPTERYLETYGALLLHCGLSAMGVPGPKDTHPLHGELPNAPYREAFLLAGEDEGGRFVALGGSFRHTVAFGHDYLAEPRVTLHEDGTRVRVRFSARNLARRPVEVMYLAHVNFRPVDGGQLVYSAPCTAERVRVRRGVPPHVTPPEGYLAFLERLAAQPELHNRLEPGLGFDPEVVFYLDYLADEAGWAHSLQRHPDNSADYLAHRPAELPKGVRWICRTPDQDALGLVLPATAEPEGYLAEKAKGNVLLLLPGATFACALELGALTANEADAVEEKIARLLNPSEETGALP